MSDTFEIIRTFRRQPSLRCLSDGTAFVAGARQLYNVYGIHGVPTPKLISVR